MSLKNYWASIPKEKRSQILREVALARWANTTKEYRAEVAQKLVESRQKKA